MSSQSLSTHWSTNCKGWRTHANPNHFLKKLGSISRSDLEESTNNCTSVTHFFFSKITNEDVVWHRVDNMRPSTSHFADKPTGLRLQTLACPTILGTQCMDTKLVLYPRAAPRVCQSYMCCRYWCPWSLGKKVGCWVALSIKHLPPEYTWDRDFCVI